MLIVCVITACNRCFRLNNMPFCISWATVLKLQWENIYRCTPYFMGSSEPVTLKLMPSPGSGESIKGQSQQMYQYLPKHSLMLASAPKLYGCRVEYHSRVVCPLSIRATWKKRNAATNKNPTTQVSAMNAKANARAVTCPVIWEKQMLIVICFTNFKCNNTFKYNFFFFPKS